MVDTQRERRERQKLQEDQVAGRLGVEPRLTESKSAVLPLDDLPKLAVNGPLANFRQLWAGNRRVRVASFGNAVRTLTRSGREQALEVANPPEPLPAGRRLHHHCPIFKGEDGVIAIRPFSDDRRIATRAIIGNIGEGIA